MTTSEKVYEGRLVEITADRYVEHYGWDRDEAEAMIREENTEQRVFVVEDGGERELENVRTMQSPSGFSWGYSGSGPTALAYSILHDFFGSDATPAAALVFRTELLATLDQNAPFRITGEQIRAWDEAVRVKREKARS